MAPAQFFGLTKMEDFFPFLTTLIRSFVTSGFFFRKSSRSSAEEFTSTETGVAFPFAVDGSSRFDLFFKRVVMGRPSLFHRNRLPALLVIGSDPVARSGSGEGILLPLEFRSRPCRSFQDRDR